MSELATLAKQQCPVAIKVQTALTSSHVYDSKKPISQLKYNIACRRGQGHSGLLHCPFPLSDYGPVHLLPRRLRWTRTWARQTCCCSVTSPAAHSMHPHSSPIRTMLHRFAAAPFVMMCPLELLIHVPFTLFFMLLCELAHQPGESLDHTNTMTGLYSFVCVECWPYCSCAL